MSIFTCKWTLENTEGAIKKAQSRETSNIGYTRREKTKQSKKTTQYMVDTTKRNLTPIT